MNVPGMVRYSFTRTLLVCVASIWPSRVACSFLELHVQFLNSIQHISRGGSCQGTPFVFQINVRAMFEFRKPEFLDPTPITNATPGDAFYQSLHFV